MATSLELKSFFHADAQVKDGTECSSGECFS